MLFTSVKRKPCPIHGRETGMSAKTRIKRPTYATSVKSPEGTYLHVSTDYRWMQGGPQSPAKFVKVGQGTTYYRKAK